MVNRCVKDRTNGGVAVSLFRLFLWVPLTRERRSKPWLCCLCSYGWQKASGAKLLLCGLWWTLSSSLANASSVSAALRKAAIGRSCKSCKRRISKRSRAAGPKKLDRSTTTACICPGNTRRKSLSAHVGERSRSIASTKAAMQKTCSNSSLQKMAARNLATD